MNKLRRLASIAAIILVVATACEATNSSSNPNESIQPMPTKEKVQPVITRMAAALRGIVTYEDGCMKINADAPNGGNTLVWPLDQYSIEIKSDRVIYEDLTSFGTSGEWIFGTHITIGGGETGTGPPHITPDFPHLPIPDHCIGKLWLIGDAN